MILFITKRYKALEQTISKYIHDFHRSMQVIEKDKQKGDREKYNSYICR